MAVDIVPELLDQVERLFKKGLETDARVLKYFNRIRDGTAAFEDVSLYARSLGELLSDVLQEVFGAAVLPDDRVYYNIANRVITPMLQEVQRLTNLSAADIQKIMDMADNIGIKPVAASFPEARVNDLINAISEDGIDITKAIERMGEPIRNISQSFFDDFVKENAAFRSAAGLNVAIIRRTSGRACVWCANLAGVYPSEGDEPEDIYRRHDRCKCTVTYKWSKGQEIVHSRQKYIDRGGLTKKSLEKLNAKLKRYPGGK